MSEDELPVLETVPDDEAVARGFSYKGKTLLSAVDPSGRADRIAEAVEISDRTLYLCPSPLYGHGLELLLSRVEAVSDSALLCIEAEPELFNLSLENLDDKLKNSPCLRITNRLGVDELCSLIKREWGSRFFTAVKIVRLNGGWQLHPALYELLARTLQKEVAVDWGNAMSLIRLGRRYMRNALRNLALVPRCHSLGEISFGGDPVLVLGAGPSLDGMLDALCARFGNALSAPEGRPFRIVCVDTCLPVLKLRGITPDLAVVLESQHWNLGDFVGLSGWKVPLAMDLSALPESGDVLSGGLCLFFTPWTQLRIFDRLDSFGLLPEALPPLGSVGLSAVAVALRLSWGTIITAGLDFSFTLDMSHARSSPAHSARLRRLNRFTGISNAETAFAGAAFSVTSKDGDRVFSNPAMRNYRDLFEREFSEFGSSPPQLFDVAGNGLSLGVKALSFETAFDILSPDSPSAAARLRPRGVKAREADAAAEVAEKLGAFARAELDRLLLLRGMLTGEADVDHSRLDALIDECDYLWAHFPDYAVSKRRPQRAEMEQGTDAAVSFLKRVRVEIDPFVLVLKSIF